MIYKLWKWIGRLWFNQVTENRAKGYLTFEKVAPRDSRPPIRKQKER